jgi:hypothetical protein
MASFSNKVILGDTSLSAPALEGHDAHLFIAWRGVGNDQLNVMFSSNGGQTFGGKFISNETSPASPALASSGSTLFIAWKGDGNDNLNVARVGLFGNTAGGFGIEGISNKVILGDTSPFAPALAAQGTQLVIAWRGDGNDNLNVMVSTNGGQTFGGKFTSNETSTASPALAFNNGILFIAWKGDGNDNLNVARVNFNASGSAVTGLSNKVILGDTSPFAPALSRGRERVFIAWRGDGNDNLNVMSSADNGQTFGGKFTSSETSTTSPAFATANQGVAGSGKQFVAWKGDGNNNLNVAQFNL